MTHISKNIKCIHAIFPAIALFLLLLFIAPTSVFADTGTCKGEKCECDDDYNCKGNPCVPSCRGHSWSGTWVWHDNDTTYHSQQCSICEKWTKQEKHSMGSWSDNGDGTHSRKCSSCEYKETKDHDYSEDWTKGTVNHAHNCKKCSAQKDKAKHTFEWQTQDYPDCVNTGNEVYKCTVCGYSNQNRILNALGHKWGESIKVSTASTCYKNGTGTRSCEICIATDDVTLPLADHSLSTEPNTGSDYGLHHTNYCTNSGCTYKETEECGNYVGAPYVKKPATCTSGSVDYVKCSKCKAENEVGPAQGHNTPIQAALGHNMSGWKQTSDSHYKICERSGCSHRENQGSHSMGSWTYENESQCYQKCSVCSYKNPQNHTLGSWQTDGTYHWKVCSKCKSNVGKVAHAWSSWTQLDGDYCK